jgi:thioredoxin reductase (NADPH)
MQMTDSYDVICIGAGPTGLASAIEAKREGLRPLVIDKGCLCNSLFHYPINLLFFTTPERMEIGDLPMTISGGKPTRGEALKYYRRAVEHYGIEVRQFERVEGITGHDGAFVVHTRDKESSEFPGRAWRGSAARQPLFQRSASLLEPGRRGYWRKELCRGSSA